jgi:hypothetical protein
MSGAEEDCEGGRKDGRKRGKEGKERECTVMSVSMVMVAVVTEVVVVVVVACREKRGARVSGTRGAGAENGGRTTLVHRLFPYFDGNWRAPVDVGVLTIPRSNSCTEREGDGEGESREEVNEFHRWRCSRVERRVRVVDESLPSAGLPRQRPNSTEERCTGEFGVESGRTSGGAGGRSGVMCELDGVSRERGREGRD